MARSRFVVVLALSAVVASSSIATAQGRAREIHVGESERADEAVVHLTGPGCATLRRGNVLDVFDDSARVYFLPLTHGDEAIVRDQKVIASLVVIDTSRDGVRARMFAAEAGVKPSALKNKLAVPNASRVYQNQPPVFAATKLSSDSAAWRRPIEVAFRVVNEEGEKVVYEWSASDGALAAGRTSAPRNRWLPPAKPGKYQVTVNATDAAGKTSIQTVEVESKGIAGPGGSPTYEYAPHRSFGSQARFASVRDIAFDPDGTMWVLENLGGTFSNEQRITIVGWDGEEETKPISLPDSNATAIALAPDAVFLLDAKKKIVRAFKRPGGESPLGEALPNIGEGGSTPGCLSSPIDLALSPDGQTVYVLDGDQKLVHAFTREGRFLHALGAPARKTRDLSDLEKPVAITVDDDGVLYVLDNGETAKRIVWFKEGLPDGAISDVGLKGEQLGGLAVDPIGGQLYVLDRAQGTVKAFNRQGAAGPSTPKPVEGSLQQLDSATRLRISPTRILHVLDRDGAALARYDEKCEFMGRSGGFKLGSDLRLAASAEGEVVALDQDSKLVTRFDRRGFAIARFGGGDSLPKPIGVAVDGAGNAFVLDAETPAVVKFSRLGGLLGSSTQVDQKEDVVLKEVRDIQVSSGRDCLLIAQDRKARTFNFMNFDLKSERAWPAENKPLDIENVKSAALFGSYDPLKGGAGTYWIVDQKGRRLSQAYVNFPLTPRDDKLDRVKDISISVAGVIFACDQGASAVRLYTPQGQPAEHPIVDKEKCSDPVDLGLDDYGRVYVYDGSTKKIVEFVESPR